jgi:hypothetical protein
MSDVSMLNLSRRNVIYVLCDGMESDQNAEGKTT